MDDQTAIEEGLRRIRIIKIVVWVLILGSFPMLWVENYLIILDEGRPPYYFSLIPMPFAVGLLALLCFVKCPRCGEIFHGTISRWKIIYWNTKCSSCLSRGIDVSKNALPSIPSPTEQADGGSRDNGKD